MKKIFVMLFIALIFLSGCGANSEKIMSTSTKTETYDFNKDLSNEISSPTNQPATESDVEEIAASSTFEITSKEIARIIYNTDIEGFTQRRGNYIVDVFPNEDYLLFCVALKDDKFPSLIYVYDQYKSGTSESADRLIQSFINNLQSTLEIQCKAYNLGGSSRNIVSCAWVKDAKAKNFPITIQIIPETDYFLFTDIDEYKAACIEGRYDDILSDVESYINTTSPPEYDNAYKLKDTLAPIVEHWNNIDVVYDSVEKYATFFFSGVDSINNNTHFVPYATTNEKNIHSVIGFYASDWLFFDNILISSTENIRISTSRNKIEEVTKNGYVYEAYDTALDDDILSELLASANHTIRFNSANSFIDYEISSEEYDALSTISNFQNVRNILSDLLFHFQKRQSDT